MVCEYRGVLPRLITTEEAPLPSCVAYGERVVVPFSIIEKIADTKSPEPYLAEVPLPAFTDLSGMQPLLALDRIADPGNLGALLRSALGFGFQGVFLIHSADPFSCKALRAAKGATFHLPLFAGGEEELLDLIEKNQYLPYVADAGGESASFKAPLVLIMGSESSGCSERLRGRLLWWASLLMSGWSL